MINDKGILIKNIYYMLTYAYQSLRQTNYKEIAGEDFENIHDLFAAILSKGAAQQLKQELYREYVSELENLPVMRGKLNLPGTFRNKLRRRQELSCEYDELSENNFLNQIIKTALLALVRQKTVSAKNRAVFGEFYRSSIRLASSIPTASNGARFKLCVAIRITECF